MRTRYACGVLLVALLPWLSAVCATPAQAAAAPGESAYLGRWDLTLHAPGREFPSWLELTNTDGRLRARLTSRWGHPRELPQVSLTDGHLRFVSPKEEEDRKDDMVFEGQLVGDTLDGVTSGQDGTPWTWSGVRAPTLARATAPRWGKPRRLFNGKDLSGWHSADPPAKLQWTVVDGALESPGHGPELVSDEKFEDFKLHIEFNRGKGANSGVYLRGRYELQVEDDPAPEDFTMRTGGVYGFIAPQPAAPRDNGVWHRYDATLVGRTLTVRLDGKTIIDTQEIPGITGGALDSHEELPGPFYLQGSEDGHVRYRNIIVTLARP
ncbi:MAG: 3-keto-disaccharide hydrolase [Steroidobacteraceae bacterium]